MAGAATCKGIRQHTARDASVALCVAAAASSPARGPQGVPASLAWLTRPPAAAAVVPAAAAGLGSGGAGGAAAGAALLATSEEEPNRLLLAARAGPAAGAASALLLLATAALADAPSADAGATGVVTRLPESAVFLQ
jgi:hypothetical protein